MPEAQTETTTRKSAVFDENGQTVEESTEEITPVEAAGDEPAAGGEAAEIPVLGKYKIGDKTFATQEEALTYAQSHVSALETETQIADAYRQGLKDAASASAPAATNVTPPAAAVPELNPEELYTNPQAFLDKYATKVKTEVLSEFNQTNSLRAQSDQIWREFTDRHPALADFRNEVEGFVSLNTPEVRAIIATKGQPSAYDWIATKLKSRFENYANAVKPKRELPNGGAGASPSSKAAGVTPKVEAKKPLSFADQIRSMKKRR